MGEAGGGLAGGRGACRGVRAMGGGLGSVSGTFAAVGGDTFCDALGGGIAPVMSPTAGPLTGLLGDVPDLPSGRPAEAVTPTPRSFRTCGACAARDASSDDARLKKCARAADRAC